MFVLMRREIACATPALKRCEYAMSRFSASR
jgi:hypothetical protein